MWPYHPNPHRYRQILVALLTKFCGSLNVDELKFRYATTCMWHVRRDHVTRDMWHMTRDTWHVTGDTWPPRTSQCPPPRPRDKSSPHSRDSYMFYRSLCPSSQTNPVRIQCYRLLSDLEGGAITTLKLIWLISHETFGQLAGNPSSGLLENWGELVKIPSVIWTNL
jgi:hypothetical protein